MSYKWHRFLFVFCVFIVGDTQHLIIKCNKNDKRLPVNFAPFGAFRNRLVINISQLSAWHASTGGFQKSKYFFSYFLKSEHTLLWTLEKRPHCWNCFVFQLNTPQPCAASQSTNTNGNTGCYSDIFKVTKSNKYCVICLCKKTRTAVWMSGFQTWQTGYLVEILNRLSHLILAIIPVWFCDYSTTFIYSTDSEISKTA